MAKIIRIIARPAGTRYTRHMHKLLESSCIKPARPTTMVFLAPSVTRVPVKVASRKRQPIHIHQHTCTFDGEYVPVSAVIALCKDVPVCCVTNHSNYTLK